MKHSNVGPRECAWQDVAFSYARFANNDHHTDAVAAARPTSDLDQATGFAG
jgi:hypothetical protein